MKWGKIREVGENIRQRQQIGREARKTRAQKRRKFRPRAKEFSPDGTVVKAREHKKRKHAGTGKGREVCHRKRLKSGR